MGIPGYEARFEGQYEWLNIGELTTEQAALAVDGRDVATVEALTATGVAVFNPDDGTPSLEIRIRTDGTEDDQFALHIYAARGNDYYQKVGIITCDQGAQECAVGAFVDVLVEAEDSWTELSVESVTDEIGRIYLNTKGYDRFVFFSPDCLDDDINTVYIDVARRDQGWAL